MEDQYSMMYDLGADRKKIHMNADLLYPGLFRAASIMRIYRKKTQMEKPHRKHIKGCESAVFKPENRDFRMYRTIEHCLESSK